MSNNKSDEYTKTGEAIGESIHSVIEIVKDVWGTTTNTISETSGFAVEKVKEWAGIEIIDDPQQIKQKANKMNSEQAQKKEEMQKELTEHHKEQPAVVIQSEHKEQMEIIENAETLNKEQADRKEQMQKELTKENKEIPPFDSKQSALERVKEKFDSTNMNEVVDKVKEVWGNTTSAIAETTTQLGEKTGIAVEKMKEWTGLEKTNAPDYQKQKAMKMNPEQSQKKHEMLRELNEDKKKESPILLKKAEQMDEQFNRKKKMQKELVKENKTIPPFDEKQSAKEKAKETSDKTSKSAEKGETAADKVKEWARMEGKDKKDDKASLKKMNETDKSKMNDQRKFASEKEKKMFEDKSKATSATKSK